MESKLFQLADRLRHYKYPGVINGVRHQDFTSEVKIAPSNMKQTGKKTLDCVGFTWNALNVIMDREWTWDDYKTHMIFTGLGGPGGTQLFDEQYSGDPSTLKPGLYLTQAWNGNKGHSFFLLVYEQGYLMLESDYGGIRFTYWGQSVPPGPFTWSTYPSWKTQYFARL